ncbi:MAG: hypothetical protein WBX03_11280 [Terriglobales bacterium]|jgi:hypothetical protein
MLKTLAILLALSACVPAVAQTTNESQPSNPDQQHAKKSKDKITVRGCVGRQSTDYILTQAEQGNSYELERSRKLRLAPYLGQEVEVTGTEYPSMSTSSDTLTRSGSASPVTIRVTAIKTISKRCSN